MDFAYDIGDEVTLVQGHNERPEQVYWSDDMDEYVGKHGVISYRWHHGATDRPAYRVEFDDGNDWTTEEYWLNPFRSIKDVTPDDDSAIDGFINEW